MENNQDELRKSVMRRCTPQKQIAADVGLSKEYFNTWLKGKKDLSKKMVDKMLEWLSK